MQNFMSRLKSENAHAAALIFFATGLSFTWFLPWLGFYWDDWLVLFHIQTSRYADLIHLYAFDRPLSAWTALLSGPILGTSALAWQLFSLAIRAVAAFALYRIVDTLLPKQRQFALWTAIIFAVYPAYRLQPISVAYSQHWISYLAFFVSIIFMLNAIMQPATRIRNTFIALFLAATHLATLEYFAGLELLRPFIVLAALWSSMASWKSRLINAIKWSAPYLSLLALWAFWRLVLLDFPVDPHPPILLTNLGEQPLAALLDFVQIAIQSITSVLFSSWQRVFELSWIDLRDRFFWVSIFFSLAISALLYWQSKLAETIAGKSQKDAFIWIAMLGLFALTLGLAPAWLIGETPIQAGYNERFALPAMLGATLFILGAVFYFIDSAQKRSLLLAILFGIASLGHFRASEAFRQDWNKQTRYFQQVSWRAPSILPDTAFIFNAPLTEFMPASSSSAALNSIYQQSTQQEIVDYWYFDIGLKRNLRALEADESLLTNYRGMQFEAQDQEAILYFYQPEAACLWLLSPQDEINPHLPPEVRAFAAYSNPERINPAQSNLNEQQIYNLDPQNSWCYYFQTFARLEQQGLWTQMIALNNELSALNLQPNIAVEWLPLLAAYIHTGDWTEALELSNEIHGSHPRNGVMLCALWQDLETKWMLEDQGQSTWQAVNSFAECP
jgi:hypothetical protein